ncbi:uncharacterized protein MYCFIDRAFT_210684 [Pseudocercospora fijiensis CIRAD86]|uniref:Yeast cell wall synthesis Kre9/Knh1-like N-terminal domain-containing protein n=1 Tax=Pseudocercospora fijiensis (strain CIRAD86) TaxID=383855 RepID=M2ZB46_PSEFD|nr:uncharacterized protein MYCFIDRAFT_210684 [Pseudocercospora fijiensis CIRAD86]EME87080.1 hypothetical protein MYCFIDRAFT_210684 [Pseudocercospora fijiensis CIRAD86]
MRSHQHLHLSFIFLFLSLLVNNAWAIGVEITSPSGGGTWPAGPITVKWVDGGGTPNMAQLTTYVLELLVGGNLPSNSKVIATLGGGHGKIQDGSVEDQIVADVAQSIENGFYFRMTSNTSSGNQVINYSNRFTLINLNGTTDSRYLDGANAVAGMDDVPSSQYNQIARPSTTSGSPSSASPTSIATTTTTATATSQPSSDDDLTTGVKVGIGVGACLALIGVISLFGWAYVFWRHKKRKQQHQAQHPLNSARVSKYSAGAFLGNKVELPTEHAESSRSRLELSPTDERYEVHGSNKPAEAARASIYELEGDWSGWEAGNGRKSKAYDPTAM